VTVDFRKYVKLTDDSRNVLAFWSYNVFTLNGKQPYLDLPATSWDTYANQGRGYAQSRFRGRNLVSLEAEYRFQISNNGLFGGVVFANGQAVTEMESNQFETVNPAYGAGLRLKMNKSSRTNIAIDYAIGKNGSGGFFVNLGEVF
jgi:hypothetical protein